KLVRHWLNRYLPVEPLLACFARPAWVDLPLDQPVLLTGPLDAATGLRLRAFDVKRHVPRFVSEDLTTTVGSVVGLFIDDLKTGGKLVYAPGVGSLTEPLLSLAREADAVLIDGTFWSDDEPIRCGIGHRTALQMGHMPISSRRGSLNWLGNLPALH